MTEPEFREVSDQVAASRSKLEGIGKLLDIPGKRKDIAQREKEAADPSFWSDSARAKKRSKELNDLKKLVGQFERAWSSVEDVQAHLELAQEAGDQGELKEVYDKIRVQRAGEDINRDREAGADGPPVSPPALHSLNPKAMWHTAELMWEIMRGESGLTTAQVIQCSPLAISG